MYYPKSRDPASPWNTEVLVLLWQIHRWRDRRRPHDARVRGPGDPEEIDQSFAALIPSP